MQVHSVEFHRAAHRPEDFLRDGRPQFAFVGRSNVGKSTLINTLLRRRNIAHVSKTPGKTQAVHYILINDKVHLVDLPGYGYAKVSKTTQAAFSSLMAEFFVENEALRTFFVLLDCRREPTEDDRIMLDLAVSCDVPTQIVLTKADKLSRGKLANARLAISKNLEIAPELVIPFSGETGLGIDKVWRQIDAALANDLQGTNSTSVG